MHKLIGLVSLLLCLGPLGAFAQDDPLEFVLDALLLQRQAAATEDLDRRAELLGEAESTLQRVIETFPDSDMAWQLASGQGVAMLTADGEVLLTLEGVQAERAAATSAACAARPTQACDLASAPLTNAAVQRRAAELADMIREQVAACWRIDGGVQEARSLVVPIRVRLSSDGRLIGDPEVQEPGRYASDRYYRSVADAAVRAVIGCSPLRLPPQDYNLWRDLVLNFTPSQMFGG